MIVFPNCKINLGLRVLGKRSDGYHDLETVFYPVALHDALEAVPSPPGAAFQLTVSGLKVPGDIGTNLCSKAYALLQRDFPSLPSMQMFLHKTIPMGAGLGGGSSDGTHTLLLLNKLGRLNLSREQLISYALELGSDCPFFVDNVPSHATGRGEILTRVDVDLRSYTLVLVCPDIHINTGWAFSKVKISTPVLPLPDILAMPPGQWKTHLSNDFETPVFEEFPPLQKIKEELNNAGALYSSLTGTGSCIYGIFGHNIGSALKDLSQQYIVHQIKPGR